MPWDWLAGWGGCMTLDLFNPEECCRAGECIIPASLRSCCRASDECWAPNDPEGSPFLHLILFYSVLHLQISANKKVSTCLRGRRCCWSEEHAHEERPANGGTLMGPTKTKQFCVQESLFWLITRCFYWFRGKRYEYLQVVWVCRGSHQQSKERDRWESQTDD